jgi:hypothetical protein
LILEPLDTNLSATATKIRLLPEVGASTVARFRVVRASTRSVGSFVLRRPRQAGR